MTTDIVDSTALTERMGDATFRAKARDLDAALRTVIRENSGTPIEGKLLGDGVLAVFTSARHAGERLLEKEARNNFDTAREAVRSRPLLRERRAGRMIANPQVN